MLGTVGFENLKVECVIGDLPEEREKEQSIFVSLRVKCDFSKCTISDLLEDTVDYVTLADVCRTEAVEGKYRMLEAYAGNTLNKLLTSFPISEAWICVKKPNCVQNADHTLVELSKRKG